MKKLPRRYSLTGIVLFGLLVAGCVDSRARSRRIREKQAVFESLTGAARRRVSEGKVSVGYTADMVYIALGHPDRIEPGPNSAHGDETWIYRHYVPYPMQATGYSEGPDDSIPSTQATADAFTLHLTIHEARVVAMKLQ